MNIQGYYYKPVDISTRVTLVDLVDFFIVTIFTVHNFGAVGGVGSFEFIWAIFFHTFSMPEFAWVTF